MWSPCWFWEAEIPKNICDQIIDLSEKTNYKRGLIDNGSEEGRNVDMKFLYENSHNWINALTCGYALYANCKNYQYKLSNCIDREGVQLSYYKVGQYYDKHVDFNGSPKSKGYTRKLSMSIQLSDSEDYEGGDFEFDSSFVPQAPDPEALRKKGTVLVFPSFFLHRVTPVTKGARKSLVAWADGPLWK